jgi:hypothetical protein
MAGCEPPNLQIPGGEREREVDADDQAGVAIGLSDQQLDEFGAGPAAFNPSQFTVDGLGQPERLALVDAMSPRPADGHDVGRVHGCGVRPRPANRTRGAVVRVIPP